MKPCMFDQKIREKFMPLDPILINDILFMFPNFTKAYVFRLINNALKTDRLNRYSRGVYCIPKETEFGIATLTPDLVATRRYVNDDNNIYGFYSGLSLLNRFVVVTQMPSTLEIISNKEKSRKRLVKIDFGNFILRKPRFEINKDNCNYYEILQLFYEVSKGFKINNMTKQLLSDYVKEHNLKQEKLLKYATSFPRVVMKQLIESGVLYEAS